MDARPEKALAELIHHNNWANQRVLAACEQLSASQLAATAPGVFGSIRDTLEHIIGSEHRTNITTILNTGLATPPGVDGWGYLAPHPERFDSTWIVR